jgi:hypothetical protein
MQLNQQKAATNTAHHSEIRIVTDENLLFNNTELVAQEYLKTLNSFTTPIEKIAKLEELVKKYHDEPALASHLASAYRDINDHEYADQIVRNNYRKFPLSIFARCDYATLCLEENRPAQAAAAIEYTFNLSNLYPKRSTFHLLEVIEFHRFLINYFCVIKDFNRAVHNLSLLQQIAEGLPLLDSLRSIIITAVLQENLSKDSLDKLFWKDEKNEKENNGADVKK